MPEPDISLYRNQILQLEAELNYVKAQLAQVTQPGSNCGLTCDDYVQLLFEVAFEGLCIHTNFVIVDVNAAICKLWGYERHEVIGTNGLNYIAPEYHEIVKTHIRNNYPHTYEVEGIKRDGSRFPMEVQGKSIQWQGQTVRVTAVRDISDRQKIEAALIDAKIRYQALFNHKSEAVFINSFTETGRPSQFIEVNDTACKSLGYTRAELLNMSPSDIMPKDFFCKREVIETLRSQKYATEEILHQTKDGRIFPVELSLHEIETVEGKPIVIAFARDISDRREAETALIEGEKRYQALFDAKAESVFIHNFNHEGIPSNFIEVNEAACISLGYTKAELLQMSPRDITPKGYKPPINIPQKLALDQFAIFEAQHQTKDGKVVPVEVRAVLLESTENLVIDFVRDISDRKAMEMDLELVASLDYLTKIPNRRQFDHFLEIEWRRSCREQTNISLILADIDFFKPYNDYYGHQMGDECLQQVAQAIAQTIKRPGDLVARYGGEEFGIILPTTNRDGAIFVAENIRQAVKDLGIKHERSTINPYVTLSLGIATLTSTSDQFSILIKAADLALYNAKQSGRDRCCTN
ncbi:PAS domain S-box/diguanylate cyclase (GGDEF) domain-containing protein [Synechococcus sp. PCC 7502]|uniref:sensor domain-containing diguanylate cyclase n=1 Tax=Synechococcus sp. PCC 7502 TaxID=1173263 RepID=UPI00029FD7CA|nr:PAS domain S-box protein [Synechococcus sp. PCC 7502]AFY72897.1 PAS domain S-box/diguanylate cyclase (GGDEF) domain-containing protein [Synechococcus sp. PCC 7502]